MYKCFALGARQFVNKWLGNTFYVNSIIAGAASRVRIHRDVLITCAGRSAHCASCVAVIIDTVRCARSAPDTDVVDGTKSTAIDIKRTFMIDRAVREIGNSNTAVAAFAAIAALTAVTTFAAIAALTAVTTFATIAALATVTTARIIPFYINVIVACATSRVRIHRDVLIARACRRAHCASCVTVTIDAVRRAGGAPDADVVD